ncbi:MAG: hypothetical protein ACK5ES_07165, partial [Planctomyces sp.]
VSLRETCCITPLVPPPAVTAPLGGRGSRRAIQSNAAKDSGSRRDDQTQQAISALRRSAHLSDKAPKSTNDAQTGG